MSGRPAATAAQAKQRSDVADLEDLVRKSEQEREEHANRPDLQLSKGINARKASSVEDRIPSQAAGPNYTSSAPAKPKRILPPGWGKHEATAQDQDSSQVIKEPLGDSNIAEGDLEVIDINEGHEYESEGNIDLPEDSVVDTESSMSDGLGLGDELEELDNKDSDYVMETNLKSDDEEFEIERTEVQHLRTKKASAKSLRGSFRHAVNAQRSTPPVTASGKLNPTSATAQKRKLDGSSTTTQSEKVNVEKRPKRSEPSGLLAGWKHKLAKEKSATIASRNAANATASAADPDDDDRDPQEYAGGVFDEDEPIAIVQAVAAKKVATTVKIIEPAPVELSASGRRTRKIRFTTASLPFPRSNAVGYIQIWRKKFKPSIVDFSGNDLDPFGTNAGVEQPALLLWGKVYPNFTREVDLSTSGRAALVQLAGDLLIGWRSTMGKAGIQIVVHSLIAEGIEQEQAVEVATYLLRDYRFIYEVPDGEGDKGAFRGPLVAKAFALYLKTIRNGVRLEGVDYSEPIGALGVAAAVIERGLELVKLGKVKLEMNAIADGSGPGKKRKVADYHPYADAHWGDKTRSWVLSAKRLDARKWNSIRAVAASYMDSTVSDDDEDGTDIGKVDPRAQIDI
ncbi:hypothetical protein M413DRAFT_13510 [Hebeloma cylindrosporum]|uniref:Uncharacterized protein n=1 Tax=Hebeloma cylindrosporum TaxID=76867 RepID=A0A0C2Y822_HEBCY|nr:hypothetical protein M413DRAFT_13510 [Hebeloma cylindrosporum h7]